MTINNDKIISQYIALRRGLRYTHIQAVRALARMYRHSPVQVAYTLSMLLPERSAITSDDMQCIVTAHTMRETDKFNIY